MYVKRESVYSEAAVVAAQSEAVGFICRFFAESPSGSNHNKNNVYWWAGAPPPASPRPSNHLKLQVRITDCPRRTSPTPPPSLTFDLVSLTDTRGGNMMQSYFVPERSQNTLCCLFCGTSRDRGKSPPVISHVALCYCVWQLRPPACVSHHGITWISNNLI